MAGPSRRSFLAGGIAAPAVAAIPAVADTAREQVAADLARYIGFGNKQSGGPGDVACGAWLAGELEQLGFRVERQPFSAPFFEPDRCELSCGTAKAEVWAQPIVRPTSAGGVTGPLVHVDANGEAAGPLAGAIALLDLPFGRLSSAAAKAIRQPISAALAAGAKAVVAITNGPTGQLIALNADGREPMFTGPVALLAPRDARPFLAAARARTAATLVLTGKVGRRPAFNFVGRLDRGKPRWLVVSTPRSGWFTCAGERGSGIAAWLWLARWARGTATGYNLAFVCNSGHEYEYLGATEALKALAPAPADTHFWLHLGASVASRDWHEFPTPWRALPNVDPQRYLSISPPLVALAAEVFRGQLGYETPYSSAQLAAGELVEIIAAGYSSAAGVFGGHRYHHVADDDARCVSPVSIAQTAAGFERLLQHIVSDRLMPALRTEAEEPVGHGTASGVQSLGQAC
jgi:hypothetical protein